MILNSKEDSDAISNFFGSQATQVYKVFHYIILWMNWKVVKDSESDECYFYTYFKEYTKQERKKVFGAFSLNLLDYLNHHSDRLESIEDLDEWELVVPLLCQDALYPFYSFYCKLSHSKHAFLILLDSKQMQWFQTGSDPLEYDFWSFVGSRYKISTELGDKVLKNKDILSFNSALFDTRKERDIPMFGLFQNTQEPKEISVLLGNMLNSHMIESCFLTLIFIKFVEFQNQLNLKENLHCIFRDLGRSDLLTSTIHAFFK